MGRHSKPKDRKKTTRNAAIVATLGMGGAAIPATFASAETLSDWEKVAYCESDSDWGIDYGDGGASAHGGGLQFQPASWGDALSKLRSEGIDTSNFGQWASGSTKEQQILAAEALLSMQGRSAWAVTFDANGAAKGCHGTLLNGSVFSGGPSPFGDTSLQEIADGGEAGSGDPADPDAFPGAGKFGIGQNNDYVTRLGEMLVARGGERFYEVGPGPKWSEADEEATAKFQRAQGWSGSGADGIPGPQTWALLINGEGEDIPPAPDVEIPDEEEPPSEEPSDPPSEDPPAEEEPGTPVPETYTVVPGDTLYGIADRFGVPSDVPLGGIDGPWHNLYEHNAEAVGDNPHLIHPGLVLTIPGGEAPEEEPPGEEEPPAEASDAQKVLDAVNVERAAVGYDALVLDPDLLDYAQSWSESQAVAGEMSHSELEFDGALKGENVAVGQDSPQAVVDAWMDSPDHMANILNPKFTKMGAAVADDAEGKPYWTQVFASGEVVIDPPAEEEPPEEEPSEDDEDAFPGAGKFGPGQDNAHVTVLGEMLLDRGADRFYSVGAGPKWSEADRRATAAFQRAQGWSGSGADGIPGPLTWKLLINDEGKDIPEASASGWVNPVAAGVSQSWGGNKPQYSAGRHTGVDYAAGFGTRVQAVGPGTVVEATGDVGAYGRHVKIRHGNGQYSFYAHLSQVSVSVGQSVSGGDKVGEVGSTGNSSGPHLHFEIRNEPGNYGDDINPLPYLAGKGA